jgi:hypothetical protein
MLRTVLLLLGCVLSLTLLATFSGCGDDEPKVGPAPTPAAQPEESESPPAADPSADKALGLDRGWWKRRPAVRLILTGGQQGRLKPCGCSEPQLGGLKRASAAIHQLRLRAKAVGTHVGVLSLGWTMRGNHEAQEDAKADYFRAVLEAQECLLALLGTPDLLVPDIGRARGPLASETPHPPLNVQLPVGAVAADAPGFGGTTVGPLGITAFALVDPARAEPLQAGGFIDGFVGFAEALATREPDAKRLTIVSSALTERSDAHLLRRELTRLGPAVLVDVSPSGFGVRKADRVRLAAGEPPLLIELEEYGKGIGVLDLDPAPDGGWLASYRLLELVPRWEAYGGPLVDEVTALDALYRKTVKERGYLVDFLRMADQGPTFLGSASCQTCHDAIYKEWKSTPHARGLETLVKADYHWDPECIRCHVQGWSRDTTGDWTLWESGFVRPDKTQHLGDVGCENCHGPGSAHVADPWNEAVWKQGGDHGANLGHPEKRACLRCHDPENSHGFHEGYEEDYLPVVDHRRVPAKLRTVVPDDAKAASDASKKDASKKSAK